MSSLIYQMSHTRQIDGCLTPTSESAVLKRPTQSSSLIHAPSPSSDLKHDAYSSSSSLGSTNSQMDTIPSPPLSPHTRNFDESDTRFTELLFPKASMPMRSGILRDIHEEEDDDERDDPKEPQGLDDTISHKTKSEPSTPVSASASLKRPFPVENLADTTLYVNPFQDIKTSGYKKCQLSFLAQYNLMQARPSVLPSRSSSTDRPSSRNSNSGIRSSYNTVSRSRYEHQVGSDYERPRTRRHVKAPIFKVEEETEMPLKRRRRKPTIRKANSATTRYDYDYTKLVDYCPPFSTLPDNPRCMKTEWKGQAMDLSDDPLVSELHPAEVLLASTLRLPCKVYLDSKRRIFAEKVKRMRSRLPFRRTDAQKACKIDVNKASRLYAAFEKVGWLNESNFRKYL
ncbi:DEKNAAC104923 [Brettanomyces naardenensis]|uniref:DEKNAAC104923 n=1 Tax=Brettanomyces naardenensis TaxID=13370 RepID=A0A448YRV3_BRENA|nr:DEKNAAC104923 [Brettanomyces naardenensis]